MKETGKKMNKKLDKRKSILLIVLIILFMLGGAFKIIAPDSKINNIISETQEIVIQEILISEETEELAIQTKEAIGQNETLETTEVIKADIEEEKEITDEGALESDAVVEQENIAYNGDITGDGLKLLGECQGPTYYSQADSRWANKPYTSTNNKTQTIKSSGCGPTSAAMIVSSSKGAILPTTMAKLFVDNGYRTANNGTAWSAYSFVADFFDFKEYYTTNKFDKAMNYLGTDKNKDGNPDYYIIASCGSGLFTSGGHYIVLADLDDSTIKVYDPYLYDGKFETASRKKANVKVKGNSAYITEKNFKKYANYKNFWIFSNDYVKPKESNKSKKYTRYVDVKKDSHLNVRKKADKNSKQVGKLTRATKVTVTKTSGKWSYITSPMKGWVSTEYLSKDKPSNIKNTVGKTKVLKNKCTLYSKSNLTGTKYTYKKNTSIKILKNISETVDYVQVKTNGRKAYIKNNNYK